MKVFLVGLLVVTVVMQIISVAIHMLQWVEVKNYHGELEKRAAELSESNNKVEETVANLWNKTNWFKSRVQYDHNLCKGGKRIAYINTNLTDECPPKMRLEKNTTTGQKACGVNESAHGCPVVLRFTVNQNYSNICGRIRGYQFGAVEAFKYSKGKTSPRQSYADGFQILQGNSFNHIWTYTIGISEKASYGQSQICPRDRSDPTDRSFVPTFVGEHFYCETGNINSWVSSKVYWGDPLWDGAGCVSDTSHSCEAYGWFYREIYPSKDNIHIKICPNGFNRNEQNVFFDLLELWVL